MEEWAFLWESSILLSKGKQGTDKKAYLSRIYDGKTKINNYPTNRGNVLVVIFTYSHLVFKLLKDSFKKDHWDFKSRLYDRSYRKEISRLIKGGNLYDNL